MMIGFSAGPGEMSRFSNSKTVRRGIRHDVVTTPTIPCPRYRARDTELLLPRLWKPWIGSA